ncbi:putative ATPase (AAA+ superfamily) [Terriglobus roseus DSM 18391]|uniref:Putative ATPase (AAA+ superfamily) n=1 Tax=Terriglobus roseus (strain DSM 18391 / NRRL B-41598 / KBS 63) TaxID=926566 RepID=I3ZJC0_TERRK|nr:ATP-binding protein [Terriglobus roseus]AFL89338.1 putative ATPase (AAA+ superfamily) [Terriglobus roseus DSM 18391]
MKTSLDALFDRRLSYPDMGAAKRLSQLVGLDQTKASLTKTLGILVNTSGPQEWAKKFHGQADALLSYVARRPPLVIFAGDVGTGKTELAESIGDSVARQEGIDITLFPLSLATRGSGRVGEMTQLLSEAFDAVADHARQLKGRGKKAHGAAILFVDEGDALTQSRENAQMHHEDRAGVNAFIRGVDRLAEENLPAVVILSTNRLNSIDPAVQRRAADIVTFRRPNDEQREAVLQKPLEELGFSPKDILEVVKHTGPRKPGEEGFTFSDLTQRLLPAIFLDAYPNQAVTHARTLQIVAGIAPTPPFSQGVAR